MGDTAPTQVEAEILIETGFKTSQHQTNRETEQTKGLKGKCVKSIGALR